MSAILLPVGAWLLGTAFLKSLDLRLFFATIDSYGLLPAAFSSRAPFVLVTCESLLGAALLVPGTPRLLYLIAGIFIATLSGVSLWAEAAGRVESCGCYGRAFSLKPRHSAVVNLVIITLLCAAWRVPPAASFPVWGYFAVAGAAVAIGSLALISRRRPLADWTPLKPGRPWPDLIPGRDDLKAGEWFLLFVTPECSICMRWLKVIDGLYRLPDHGGIPAALGIVSATESGMSAFRLAHPARLPLAPLRPEKFVSAVYRWPMAVILRDGIVAERWMDQLPEKYVAPLRPLVKSGARER